MYTHTHTLNTKIIYPFESYGRTVISGIIFALLFVRKSFDSKNVELKKKLHFLRQYLLILFALGFLSAIRLRGWTLQNKKLS